MRKRPRAEIDEAVRKALNLVRLKQMGERYPRQLSGGQQQRVALARALAIRPNLLLLDEPLSNLDAQLRDEMRDEIRRIQHDTGVTAIFVTHDQGEALALADRVAVMEGGRILQLDDPYSIYETPKSSFVGSFIGQSNVLNGKVTALNDDIAEVTTEAGLSVTGRNNGASLSGPAMVQVKKERVVLTRAPAEGQKNVFPGRIEDLTYLGHTVGYRCALAGHSVEALVPNHPAFERFQKDDSVFVHWSLEDCRVFPG
jgi:putative spermidine/putrescine transport system ATP-binding protein